MPSWVVGSETLPVAAAGANAAWRDPTLVGLLAYFGHWLKYSLDTRLAELQGPEDSDEITDACPVAHRFPWDHNGTFMREHKTAAGTMSVALPGLWAWCTGEVESDEGASLLYEGTLQREIRVHYVFPEVQIPDGYNARSGLLASVGRALNLAVRLRRHPTFSYGIHPANASIEEMLNIQGMRVVRGDQGRIGVRPAGGTTGGQGRARDEGSAQRFFPAYEMQLQVFERIYQRNRVVPDDVMGDSTLTIANGESVADATDILERVLLAPSDVIDPTP
jgi:hypothetical protein